MNLLGCSYYYGIAFNRQNGTISPTACSVSNQFREFLTPSDLFLLLAIERLDLEILDCKKGKKKRLSAPIRSLMSVCGQGEGTCKGQVEEAVAQVCRANSQQKWKYR